MPIFLVVGWCGLSSRGHPTAITAIVVQSSSLIRRKGLRLALGLGIGCLAIARMVNLTFGRL